MRYAQVTSDNDADLTYRKVNNKRTTDERSDSDESIGLALDATADIIDKFTLSSFHPSTVATPRTFKAHLTSKMEIDACYDTVEVTDPNGNELTVYPVLHNGQVYALGGEFDRYTRYTVTAKWGSATIPPAIIAANIELAAIWRLESPFAVSSVGIEEAETITDDASRTLRRLLNTHRLPYSFRTRLVL